MKIMFLYGFPHSFFSWLILTIQRKLGEIQWGGNIMKVGMNARSM